MKKFNSCLICGVTLMFLQTVHAQTEQTSETQAASVDANQPADLDIRVRKAGSTTVKEYHAQGRTYKVEIAPENTPAYILSDQDGNGNINSSGTSIDSDLVVPEWTIGNW